MRKRRFLLTIICGMLSTVTACGNYDIGDKDAPLSQSTEENPVTQSEEEGSLGALSHGEANPVKDNAQDALPNEYNGGEFTPDYQFATEGKMNNVGSVDSSAFSGKVRGCYYADGSRIIVAADRLCLYDTQTSESITSVDIALEDFCVQAYSEGYLVVGQGNGNGGNGSFTASQSGGGITGYLLNRELEIEDTISFQGLLNDDFVLGTADVAISWDGKRIAFGGLRGLYLYDTSAGELSTILNYSENGAANNIQIMTIDSLAFTGDDTLVYVGTGTDSSNGGYGFSVYGTVSAAYGNLAITRKADYEVEEMQKGGALLVMPQSFDKNNGTLLLFDTTSNTEKMITFSSGSEGKDGVFCSSQGRYVATSTLEGDSVTINIYDIASGKAIHTETISDSNSAYFLRIPQVLILDESNTCIVVLGRGINDVSTLITAFGFEG